MKITERELRNIIQEAVMNELNLFNKENIHMMSGADFNSRFEEFVSHERKYIHKTPGDGAIHLHFDSYCRIHFIGHITY